MSKLEKEVKVLNIDIDYTRDKLIEIGATFINKKEQEIYTYDIPTIYYRFEEALQLLKSTNKLMINTSLTKLRIVLEEFVDLVSDDELNEIYFDLNISSFDELLKLPPKKIIDLVNIKSNAKKIDTRIENDMESKYVLILANGDLVITKNGKDVVIGNALRDSIRIFLYN